VKRFNRESESMNRRTLFCSVNAQWDNLGDIEIRQTLVAWALETSVPMVIFVGDMPQDYVDAFAFPTDVRLVRSPVEFEFVLLKHALGRKASIAFAPGPQYLSSRPRAVAKTLANMVNVMLVRSTGGKAIAVGRALRGSGRLAEVLERVLIRQFDLFTVRDNASSTSVAQHLELQPDLAFAHRGISNEPKPLALISLRSDVIPDQATLTELVDDVRRRGYIVQFVTQVKRDDAQHAQLATRFNCSAVLWGEKSHLEQFEAVRAAYASADIVVSNRLHALILGIQHGAFPIAFVEPGADKLPTTLGPWIDLFSINTLSSVETELDLLFASGLGERKMSLFGAVAVARARLEGLKLRVQNLL
jgi:hypothetical protein